MPNPRRERRDGTLGGGGATGPSEGEGSFYQELSAREMMTLAMRGRAVSPVTSYLAIEPGVRPSTEGLVEGEGSGGGGNGEGTIVLGTFGTLGERHFDPKAFLRGQLVKARATCEQTDSGLSVRIETAKHEIVDVPAVMLDRGRDTACVREAIWSRQLPDDFTDERASYTINLPAANKV